MEVGIYQVIIFMASHSFVKLRYRHFPHFIVFFFLKSGISWSKSQEKGVFFRQKIGTMRSIIWMLQTNIFRRMSTILILLFYVSCASNLGQKDSDHAFCRISDLLTSPGQSNPKNSIEKCQNMKLHTHL